MRPWDLDTNAAHLRDAMDDLQIAWEHTSESWQDEVSQKFLRKLLGAYWAGAQADAGRRRAYAAIIESDATRM